MSKANHHHVPAQDIRLLHISVVDSLLGDNWASEREMATAIASHLARLDYIAYSPRSHGYRTVPFSDRLTVYPTQSRSKLHFFRDAFRLGDRLCRHERHNLIEVMDPMACGLVGYWLKRRYHLPLLMVVHSDYYGSPVWRRQSVRYRFFDYYLSLWLLRKADWIRTVSERVRQDVIGLVVRTDRIVVVPTLSPYYLFTPGSDSIARYEQGKLLFVGRLAKEKGLSSLLVAMKLLVNEGYKPQLTIVGSGQEEKRLKALTHQLEIQSRVEFAGAKGHEELVSYYQNSSMLILPSLQEALGKVLVEAGLCRLPTIGTQVGGIPENIVPEQTGLLVPPDDPEALKAAIARCLDDPDFTRRLGQEAHNWFRERWDFDTLLQRRIDLQERAASTYYEAGS